MGATAESEDRARERRCVALPAARICYQALGAGPPLVLVHGLSGSGRWWARNTAALAAHCRVYVVDLIGFGASRHGHRFVLREAADHLAAWMERLDLPRAHVVGHSMGGFIAVDLAARYPDRVDHLVLVDAAALRARHRYWRRALGLARGLARLPLGFVPVLVTDACRAGPVTILNAARDLLAGDLRAELARIHAPTLVVWGEHDSVVPHEVGEQLAAHLPNARFEVIPGAGHNPMWDRPSAFNAALLAFLGVSAADAAPPPHAPAPPGHRPAPAA
jgi:pimeloyl-ACP methyl ester carboxylesterase